MRVPQSRAARVGLWMRPGVVIADFQLPIANSSESNDESAIGNWQWCDPVATAPGTDSMTSRQIRLLTAKGSRLKRRTRTTEIKIESEEIYLLRRSRRPIRAWCAECEAVVQMVTPDEAANLAGVTARTVYRWIEQGKVHFTETAAGKATAQENCGIDTDEVGRLFSTLPAVRREAA